MEPSNELSALLDRSPADIRGVKYAGSPGLPPLRKLATGCKCFHSRLVALHRSFILPDQRYTL